MLKGCVRPAVAATARRRSGLSANEIRGYRLIASGPDWDPAPARIFVLAAYDLRLTAYDLQLTSYNWYSVFVLTS